MMPFQPIKVLKTLAKAYIANSQLLTNLEFVVKLENGLGFVAQLSKAGAEAGHLLPPLVRNVHLIGVYFPEQQIHVHEGFVKLLLEHFEPAKH